MIPQHGVDPQNTPPPYTLSAKLISRSQGDVLQGEAFKGFFLQARLKSNTSVIVNGEFSPSNESHVVKCKLAKNTLTHNNNNVKKILITTWMPPANFKEEIIFRTTVLKDYRTFWVNIDSFSPSIVVTNTVGARTMAGPSSDLYDDCVAKEKVVLECLPCVLKTRVVA
ncbi:putative defense protein [Tachypleus tridentatus]|uniref:putative defense protein n=1 Tax=Tachypleus tridentatus TaxID=6853 RepID=UPI003FCF4266